MIRRWKQWVDDILTPAFNGYKTGAVSIAALRQQVDAALIDDVLFAGAVVGQHNDHGKLFNSMGAGAMGCKLYEIGQELNDAPYIETAIKILDTLLTNYASSGLRLVTSSGWHYYSTTSSSDADPGVTPNQAAFTWRFLHRASILTGLSRYSIACQQGIYQFTGHNYPRSINYIPKNARGEKLKRSWMFYALNKKREGHFLPVKIGGYHMVVMSILADLSLAGYDVPSSKLDWFIDVYERKLKDGLFVNSSASPGGDFRGLDQGQELKPYQLTWWRNI